MRAHADAAYVQLIVNEGGGAGASLEHTHAQLYALPFVPAAVARERERAGAYGERTAGAAACSRRAGRGGAARRAAGRDRRRGGADLPLGLALAVRAAGDPAARGRRASRRTSGGAAMIATAMRVLADALRLARRSSTSGCAPRRTAPSSFHWHVDIAPRLTIKAGFELGTGVDINIYPPEQAAVRPARLPLS